jgi:hypothetical protein
MYRDEEVRRVRQVALDLRIWFTQIRITTYEERDIPVPEFIASGVRWWDGLHSGDPRTSGKGIFPLRGE